MNPDDLLTRAGVSTSELECSGDQVTPGILRVLPSGLLDTADETTGFGLSGLAGIGKTGLMVAFARALAPKAVPSVSKPPPTTVTELEQQQRDREHPAPPWMVWHSWPDTVNRMRILSMQDGGIIQVGKLVDRATKCATLFLDDVGAERIRGAYVDDWAASQLDLIVDGRYREKRPIWFTTGLNAQELGAMYGRRLFSRLCSENRFYALPQLPDRRFAAAPR